MPDQLELRVLVVDDERLARELVRGLLARMPSVRVVGECGDGVAAAREIARLRPNLVLLDVQMPEVDGFDVLERVGSDAMPEVIFVTAHEQYTLRAFEVHAVDYVVKPIDPDRLNAAVEHARTRIAQGRGAGLAEKLVGLLEELGGRTDPDRDGYARRITVEKGGSIRFVSLEDVDWLESARNYVRLHVDDESYLVRSSLKGLLRRLDPDRFVRIHRSAAVNLDRVAEVRSGTGGDYVVSLRDGESLRASRTYADRLLKLIH